MTSRNNIAIIGSGISGLSCAYILRQHAQITLFEANPYFGGHTNTVKVIHQQQEYAIDTGFIVFNKKNYPFFTKLLQEIAVPYQHSEMSFSFSSRDHRLEYNGHNVISLFGQKRNLLRPRFYRLLADILRFNRDAKHLLQSDGESALSLTEFVNLHRYDEWFWQTYLQPMVSAIWSSTPETAGKMPAKFILQFFDNHGMLSFNDIPQWLTICGGSQRYVQTLLQAINATTLNNARVSKVTRNTAGVTLHIGTEQLHFDRVIFACHSDTALQLLENPSADEINILSAIRYQNNEVILHSDPKVMPKRKKIWASWNYYSAGVELPTLTYYMNRLQALTAPLDFFVSVNLTEKIDPSKVFSRHEYAHPVLDQQAINAQKLFNDISGKNNSFFCGAYWFNGFHEDGVASAVRVCKQLGVDF